MINRIDRRFLQLGISGVIIATIVVMLFSYAVRAKKIAVDTRKKIDLAQLYKVLSNYALVEETMPENPSEEDWCEIDKLYGHKKCLRELGRDGYTAALPVSPDDEPYYYYNDEDKFFVATRLSREVPKGEQCPDKNDPFLWCKVFEK